ncbi:MAG TPA: DUF998 domain-containing protein [Actinomycetales bacterium]|nr:DUF998 domain-containing protein [Actinomycetales bacterium]
MTDTDTTPRTRRVTPRSAAVAGIAVPLVFLPTVALLTWAEYDFMTARGWSPVADSDALPFPSALARGPYGWVQDVNFLLAGMLALVLLAGLRRCFRRRRWGYVATVALGMFGVAGLLNAVPTSLPGEEATLAGTLHFIGFLMTMLGGVVGTLAAGLALRGDPAWRGWWVYSVLTPVGMVASATGLLGTPSDSGFYVLLLLLFGWFGVMGARLYRVTSRA